MWFSYMCSVMKMPLSVSADRSARIYFELLYRLFNSLVNSKNVYELFSIQHFNGIKIPNYSIQRSIKRNKNTEIKLTKSTIVQ